MATSPLPDSKFLKESLALLSSTVTFLKMPSSSFSALAGSFAVYPGTFPRVAALLRIGCQDLKPRLGQVAPVVDALRIARSHHETHNRGGHDRPVLILLPVMGDQAGLLHQLDVGRR